MRVLEACMGGRSTEDLDKGISTADSWYLRPGVQALQPQVGVPIAGNVSYHKCPRPLLAGSSSWTGKLCSSKSVLFRSWAGSGNLKLG